MLSVAALPYCRQILVVVRVFKRLSTGSFDGSDQELLQCFEKLLFARCVCMSVRVEQHGSHRTEFHEI